MGIGVPKLAAVDVDLVRRRTLGGPGDMRVAGQIAIGRSEPKRLHPDSPEVGPELARQLEREAERHHYHLLMLSCTIRPAAAPVVRATFSVQLLQATVTGVPDPVVWSMDPLRRATPVKHRREISVGPSIKIIPEIVELGGTAGYTDEYTSQMWHVVGLGEGESQVEWVFTATPAVDLTGVHHLGLVAKTSARVSCRADLALAATRQEKKLGLVPYRAEIPPRLGTVRFNGTPM